MSSYFKQNLRAAIVGLGKQDWQIQKTAEKLYFATNL